MVCMVGMVYGIVGWSARHRGEINTELVEVVTMLAAMAAMAAVVARW